MPTKLYEWECSKCHDRKWAKGKPQPKGKHLVRKAMICKKCPKVMEPTGLMWDRYSRRELL